LKSPTARISPSACTAIECTVLFAFGRTIWQSGACIELGDAVARLSTAGCEKAVAALFLLY
jgi:hypothetical protein